MLDIVRSNLYYPAQILFFGLNGIGLVLGLVYNSKTPDLYPNNSHYKIGWALLGIMTLSLVVGILRARQFKQNNIGVRHEQSRYIPLSRIPTESGLALCHDTQGCQPSTDTGTSVDSTDETDSETLHDVAIPSLYPRFNQHYNQTISWKRRWWDIKDSYAISQFVKILCYTCYSTLVTLGFAAICSGIVTMAGIFVSRT